MTNPIPAQDSHEAPATFTVRPLTAAELTRVAGAAGYLKIGDIKGESVDLAPRPGLRA